MKDRNTPEFGVTQDKYHIILGISDVNQSPNLDTINTIINGEVVSIKIPDLQ